MVAEVFGTAFLIPAAQCEFEMGSTEKGLLNAIGCMGKRKFCSVTSYRFGITLGMHYVTNVR
jgi:hypothetical protein